MRTPCRVAVFAFVAGWLASPGAAQGAGAGLRADASDWSDYQVKIGGGFQFRYTASVAPDAPDDDVTSGFSFRRLRPHIRVTSPDKEVMLYVQTEAAPNSDVRLLDGWVAFQLTEDLRLRLGRIHFGFSREQEVSAFRQLAVDRSSVANTVNPDEGDRIQGVDFLYTRPRDRVAFAVAEGFGMADATFNDPNAGWSLSVRYDRLLIGENFKQFDQHTAPRGTKPGLMLGLAGHAQHLDELGDRVAFAADLSYQNNGFSAMLAAEGRDGEDRNRPPLNEPESAYGAVGQMAYYVTDTVEPFIRYEHAVTSDGNHPDLSVLTVGYTWYVVGQALKFTADASVAFDGVGPAFDRTADGLLRTPEGDERFVLRAQIQMLF